MEDDQRLRVSRAAGQLYGAMFILEELVKAAQDESDEEVRRNRAMNLLNLQPEDHDPLIARLVQDGLARHGDDNTIWMKVSSFGDNDDREIRWNRFMPPGPGISDESGPDI